MPENGVTSESPSTEALQAEIERLRAERAALRVELEGRKKPERHFPWRPVLMWTLIVLATLMAILAPIATWTRTTFLNTDNFVKTVGPLISDETVAQAVSTNAANRLFTELDLQERIKSALDEALPDKLGFIAGPVANGLQSLTQKLTYEIITSSQFEKVWERILQQAHSTAVGIIEGDKAVVVSSNGEVTLDVGEVLNNAKSRLVDLGLTFLDKVPIPKDAGTIVLFTSPQMGAAKNMVDLLNILYWLLPLLALILYAAAVIISKDRRRALMIVAIVIAIAMSISLITLNVAKSELLGQVKNENNLAAVGVIWDDLTHNLIQAEVGLLFFGLVAALGFAIAGPYGWAVWLRRKSGYLFELEREHRLKGKESGPVGIFFATHIWGLRVAGATVIFAILYLTRPLNAGKVLIALIVYLVYLVVCELLRGRLPESTEVAGEEGKEVEPPVKPAEEKPAEEEKAEEEGAPSAPSPEGQEPEDESREG